MANQNGNNVPFEVSYEKAKYRIADYASRVAEQLKIPPQILVMMLKEIANETTINTQASILANYAIMTNDEASKLLSAKAELEKQNPAKTTAPVNQTNAAAPAGQSSNAVPGSKSSTAKGK